MKIKDGFMLRQIAENNIVVAVGKATLDFSGMITLNASAAFLWSLMQNEISVDELTAQMCQAYDIDFETAKADIDEFISQLKGAGIVE